MTTRRLHCTGPRSAAAAMLAAALALGCARAPVRPGADAAGGREAAVNGVVELRLAVPAGAPVRAEVLAPSGARIHVPAFPVPGGWAARFRPREPGRHRWVARSGEGAAAAEVARGEVMAEDRGLAGQVIVSGGTLRTEDGRPFRPLGENRFNVYDPTWSDGLSPADYVARMAADGMNALRVFVFTACGRAGTMPNPGCLEPVLGAFDEAAAARYDAIFAAAEAHGVKVVLSVFAIGFTPGDAWKGWEENPYSAARGGPAAGNTDFFLDPRAREAARARLRYVLARWGASPALLAIDLLNEPEWDGAIPEDHWIPWAEDLARTWRAEDPYGHPVTAGPVGLHWNVEEDERAWWASAACDIVQWHRYGPDVHDVHDLAEALVETTRDTARYGKPVLIGEFGWGGDAKPEHDHTHVGIWAATFAGAGVLSHSAPPFTEDSDEPMTPARARHFRTLAAFLRRAEARGPLAPAPEPAVRRAPGLRALALGGERAAAVWLLAPRPGYGGRVKGARLTLAGIAPGRWRVTWVEDVSGEVIAVEERDASGPLPLDVPPFARHVAALVERIE
ncbi:cellulase family glycosylhydrolase [Anaeromyxobacter sp. Fw109-5]|uniref:cellulase family glycosylhydrolase n=1 Tax=Anaeromyxobacter sp. (strain Fw109-5) TaxID=404589 RepID=UPI00117F141F|nr:cellulase family glycosylhydrolase [Anaeromyxobacter sp. Fw109-5]